MLSLLHRIRDAVVDTVYPRVCAGCGLRGTWLCDLCAAEVVALVDVPCCGRCGIPTVDGRCSCADLHPNFVEVASAFPYTQWVSQAVRRMKYEDEWSRAAHLASFLVPIVARLGPIDALIPVPLHERKERERGYNQSRLLADNVGRTLGIPVLPMVERHRSTKQQVGLSGSARIENVAGAFSLNDRYVPHSDGRYILVDDVRTTGSTLNGCATALAEAGITRVWAVTVAVDLHAEHLALLRSLRAKA